MVEESRESFDSHDQPGMSHDQPGTLRIASVVAGGDGMARRSDGCVVFVPRSAPGDVVEVEYTEIHRQWCRARITRVIETGPARLDPPCPYYERCGGCQLQHIRYESQLGLKVSIIVDSLRRLGGLDRPPPDITPSANEFGYRNRLSFVVRRSATGIAAGYHAFDDPRTVIDVDRCPLGEPALDGAWRGLRALWMREMERMPDGPELRLTLRANHAGSAGLAVEGFRTAGDVNAILGAAESLDAVWLLDDRGTIVARAGSKTLNERWGSWDVQLAGTSFMQVNRDTARHMLAYAQGQCGAVDGMRVVDAYCGFGLNALELSRLGANAVGIDADRHAVKEASRLAAQAGVPVRFVTGGVERVLHRELPADIVILNPPRHGVQRPVIEALIERPPRRIIYVSCNPATLARDLKGLAGRFELAACRAFDLFPQTAHVETVATLSLLP
jgi:23S rRNA (uracil1939-C5)-methyltransferase